MALGGGESRNITRDCCVSLPTHCIPPPNFHSCPACPQVLKGPFLPLFPSLPSSPHHTFFFFFYPTMLDNNNDKMFFSTKSSTTQQHYIDVCITLIFTDISLSFSVVKQEVCGGPAQKLHTSRLITLGRQCPPRGENAHRGVKMNVCITLSD